MATEESAKEAVPRFREDWCLDAAAAIEARAGVQTPVDPEW